jgi:hypothetical protein
VGQSKVSFILQFLDLPLHTLVGNSQGLKKGGEIRDGGGGGGGKVTR